MKRWVMLQGQALAQWHLFADTDERGRLLTLCGLSLGDDPEKLSRMSDDQLTSNRCAACSEKTLQQLFGPLEQGD